jgi:hypothetical protein
MGTWISSSSRSSNGDYFGEDDIVRLEDDFGRIPDRDGGAADGG